MVRKTSRTQFLHKEIKEANTGFRHTTTCYTPLHIFTQNILSEFLKENSSNLNKSVDFPEIHCMAPKPFEF